MMNLLAADWSKFFEFGVYEIVFLIIIAIFLIFCLIIGILIWRKRHQKKNIIEIVKIALLAIAICACLWIGFKMMAVFLGTSKEEPDNKPSEETTYIEYTIV